jgi:hypothetical protein
MDFGWLCYRVARLCRSKLHLPWLEHHPVHEVLELMAFELIGWKAYASAGGSVSLASLDRASPPTGYTNLNGIGALAGDINLVRVQVPVGAGGHSVSKLSIYIDNYTPGALQIGFYGVIYADSTAYPGALLAQSAIYTTPAVTNAWTDLAFTGYSLPADGTWIWFGLFVGDANVGIWSLTGTADGLKQYTASGWPNGWPGAANATFPVGATVSSYDKPYVLYYT